MEDGKEFEGTTDDNGLSQDLKSSIPFAEYELEVVYD